MEIAVTKAIREVLQKEDITNQELAKRIGIEPWRVTRFLGDDKDIRSLVWIEFLSAIGYELRMVPKNAGGDTIVLDSGDNTPLKVLNRILVISADKKAEVVQQLGISRQAMSQITKSNNDIRANRFVEIAGILGYEVRMEKVALKVVE